MLTSTAWPEGAAALERIFCLAETVSIEREERDHRRIFVISIPPSHGTGTRTPRSSKPTCS